MLADRLLNDGPVAEVVKARLAVYRLIDSEFEKNQAIVAAGGKVDQFPVLPGSPSPWQRVYSKSYFHSMSYMS